MDEEIIEPCEGCGRRSSQSWGALCRYCYGNLPPPEEKVAFLALCQRQAIRMTDPSIYFRRRKNALKLAAIAHNRKAGVTDTDERFRLVMRADRRMEHFILIDEIWNYLNPTQRFASDWGKGFEVSGAAKALTEGSFDALCDKNHEF